MGVESEQEEIEVKDSKRVQLDTMVTSNSAESATVASVEIVYKDSASASASWSGKKRDTNVSEALDIDEALVASIVDGLDDAESRDFGVKMMERSDSTQL